MKIESFLKFSTEEILDGFSGINGSFSEGEGNKRFVFVPGHRPDKVLIVAHADTAWDDSEEDISPVRKNREIISSKQDKKIGIGADDRVGCYFVWKMRNLGHSLLITSGEEKGCLASFWIKSHDKWKKKLNDEHCWMVEFDRKGKNDLALYDVGTNKFAEFLKKETGMTPCSGGFRTDIKVLCEDICGVNVSVGYYDQHLATEKIILSEMFTSFRKFYNLLKKPQEKYVLDKSDIFRPVYEKKTYVNTYTNNNNNDNDKSYDYETNYTPKKTLSELDTILFNGIDGSTYDSIVTCQSCGTNMTEEHWCNNGYRCVSCEETC